MFATNYGPATTAGLKEEVTTFVNNIDEYPPHEKITGPPR